MKYIFYYSQCQYWLAEQKYRICFKMEMFQNLKENQKDRRKRRHNVLFYCVNPIFMSLLTFLELKKHLIKKKKNTWFTFLYNRLSLYVILLLLYIILWILDFWSSCYDLWHSFRDVEGVCHHHLSYKTFFALRKK